MIEEWFRVREHLPSHSFIECSLEDLVADPELELRKICCFLSIPWDPDLLDVDISRHHTGRWKKDFSAGEAKVVGEALGDVLEKLGYEQASVGQIST